MVSANASNVAGKWKSEVWISAITVAIIAGVYVGAVLARSFSGAVLGAFMAIPAGAIAAVIVTVIGKAWLSATSFETPTPLTRFAFALALAFAVALVSAILTIPLGGLAESAPAVLALTSLAFAFGVVRPPRPE